MVPNRSLLATIGINKIFHARRAARAVITSAPDERRFQADQLRVVGIEIESQITGRRKQRRDRVLPAAPKLLHRA